MTAAFGQPGEIQGAPPTSPPIDEKAHSRYFQQIEKNLFELRVASDSDTISHHAAMVAMSGVTILREHEKQWRPEDAHIEGCLTDIWDENGRLLAVRFGNPRLMIAALSIHFELGKAKELSSDARGAALAAANDLRLLIAERNFDSQQAVIE